MRESYRDEDIEFEDEMRIGTRTALGRKWTPIGIRPIGRQQIGMNICICMFRSSLLRARCLRFFCRVWTRECFSIFINERSLRLKRRTLLVADGATAHRLEENDLVELVKLPPYSPELNPVERFFEELRRKLEFRVFETLEQAEDFVGAAIQEFLQDKERVKSLTLFPYIKHARSILN
ncbi:MAG: transposase [Pyrinomonadaceae bacterium]